MTFKNLFSGENAKKIPIIGAAAVMVLLMLSTVSCGGKTQTRARTETVEDAAKIERELEQRLTELIAKIDGAGTVNVMVTLDSSTRTVYEKDVKTETNAAETSDSGTQNNARETEVVLAGSSKEPLEAGTVQPKVRGAAVVCGGAEDPVIREKVTYTVARALNIGISKVYVTY